MYWPCRPSSTGVTGKPSRDVRTGTRGIGANVGRIRIEVVAEARRLSTERPDVDVERDALEEAAVAPEDLAAAVPRGSQTTPILGAQAVVDVDAGLAEAIVHLLPLPPEAGVDRQIRRHPPTVLRIERRVERAGS